MKLLIVANNNKGHYAPFIKEQVSALQRIDDTLQVEWYGIRGHGILGYFRNYPSLKRIIVEKKPDVIHAHYGLCGLVANLQRKVPVVTTYHGSDINDWKVRLLSYISVLFSTYNIFVSSKIRPRWASMHRSSVIPCGVDIENFPYMEKSAARRQMGFENNKKYVLFASAFNNQVKNPELAINAMSLMPKTIFLEMKGYSRKQVATLLSAVDALLMTSHSEGSPQVIKEALACGCPIVSVDVGDVRSLVADVPNCYISSPLPHNLASALQKMMQIGHVNTGRNHIQSLQMDNRIISQKIIGIYTSIVSG